MRDRTRMPQGTRNQAPRGARPVRPSKQRPESKRSSKLQTILWIAAAGGVLFALTLSQMENPGEIHYENARQMVETFELGKVPANINYGDAVFEDALTELGLVPVTSEYDSAARSFAAEIRNKIERYRREIEAMQVAQNETLERSRSRRETLFENQRQARIQPTQAVFPECEDEEKDAGDHEDHSH